LGSCNSNRNLNMYCVLSAALLNIGLNFLLVPKFGYMAAAITTFISYAFMLILVILVSRRFFVWEFPFKSLAKTASASGVMALVIYPVGNSITASPLINLIIAVFLGAAVYLVTLFLLKEIQPEEKELIKQIAVRCLPEKLIPAGWKQN